MDNIYICFIGIIGAGKTIGATQLHKFLKKNKIKSELSLEKFGKNIFLDKFYKSNFKKYSLEMELSFMSLRLKQENCLDSIRYLKIKDRSILEDFFFYSLLLEDKRNDFTIDKYNLLNPLLTNILKQISKNKKYIFIKLNVHPKNALNRIILRGRENELNIELNYLKMLYDSYKTCTKKLIFDIYGENAELIEIDWNENKSEKKIGEDIYECVASSKFFKNNN